MAEMAEMAAGSRLSCYDLAALGPRGASQGAAGNWGSSVAWSSNASGELRAPVRSASHEGHSADPNNQRGKVMNSSDIPMILISNLCFHGNKTSYHAIPRDLATLSELLPEMCRTLQGLSHLSNKEVQHGLLEEGPPPTREAHVKHTWSTCEASEGSRAMTSSRSSLGLGRQMIFHSDARHGKPTRHHGHWKFQKLHGENLWISMGSHWWKFHSHVRINNINNIYIYYI